MRILKVAAVLAAAGVAAGCGDGPGPQFTGPTVKAFDGRLLHDGKPVSFADGREVVLDMRHEKGTKFGVPIRGDGTFKIGWMPVGKYSASLNQSKPVTQSGRPGANLAPQSGYPIPGGAEIKEGQTEYAIELGKNWKP